MINKKKFIEFDKERARLYEEALQEYPLARAKDIESMRKHLNPQSGENILGIGEGNGYFCSSIVEAVGKSGKYTVTDPSPYQLTNLRKRINLSQLEIIAAGAEEIPVREDFYDKVWSFGAFHHCQNQTEAMKRVYKSLKTGGTAVICDVFQGSKLANHFDSQVALYCNTGHEVKFLSDAFARTLCKLAEFKDSQVAISELPQKWVFNSQLDLGKFIYKLHALTFLPGNEQERAKATLESCSKILGVSKNPLGRYELNWPMKVLKAIK
jgi:ubiquinone/menaquinone biosynthesis C-methylase UbiE